VKKIELLFLTKKKTTKQSISKALAKQQKQQKQQSKAAKAAKSISKATSNSVKCLLRIRKLKSR
jgi:hypothetical protein